MNGLDRSPKELNGDIKPKKEQRGTPNSETSSINGSVTTNGSAIHKQIKDVCDSFSHPMLLFFIATSLIASYFMVISPLLSGWKELG